MKEKSSLKDRYFKLLVALLIFSPLLSFSQNNILTSTVEEQKTTRPAYLDIALGINFSTFRDFATSPLTYSGSPVYIALSHLDLDIKRESSIGLSYFFGTYESNFNEHKAVSKVNTITLNYLELFQLSKLSSSKINVKVGGQFNSTVNIRNNELLQNNSQGFEVISTLFGSINARLDLSPKKAKRRKITRHLTYRLNIGLINSSYRNGFAYTSQSALLNEDNLFDQYEFQIFSGYRINSKLDYTFWLSNKNAIQFSYLWDAYRTGGNHDEFEMAAHIVKFSLLYNLK